MHNAAGFSRQKSDGIRPPTQGSSPPLRNKTHQPVRRNVSMERSHVPQSSQVSPPSYTRSQVPDTPPVGQTFARSHIPETGIRRPSYDRTPVAQRLVNSYNQAPRNNSLERSYVPLRRGSGSFDGHPSYTPTARPIAHGPSSQYYPAVQPQNWRAKPFQPAYINAGAGLTKPVVTNPAPFPRSQSYQDHHQSIASPRLMSPRPTANLMARNSARGGASHGAQPLNSRYAHTFQQQTKPNFENSFEVQSYTKPHTKGSPVINVNRSGLF